MPTTEHTNKEKEKQTYFFVYLFVYGLENTKAVTQGLGLSLPLIQFVSVEEQTALKP